MTRILVHQNGDGSLALTTVAESVDAMQAVEHGVSLASRYGDFVAVKEPKDFEGMDRYFRGAWRLNPGAGLEYDLDACRAHHTDKLRRLRTPLLEAADIAIQRESDRGESPRTQELRAYRQALRDFPTDIASQLAAATTPEAIKAVRPAVFDQKVL